MTDPHLASNSPRSPWREAWRRLRQNRLAVSCGGILIAIFLACLIGPAVTAERPSLPELTPEERTRLEERRRTREKSPANEAPEAGE